jgi:hypothetical protein
LAGFARDLLLSPTCRQRGLFDPRGIERLLRLNQRGRDVDLQLWTLLSFELWCRHFLDRSIRNDRPTRRPARRPPSISPAHARAVV